MKLSFFILAAIVALSYAPHGKCKRKKINLDKLAKEWNDEEEDEAWHEDTHEWKRKMNDKNKKPLKACKFLTPRAMRTLCTTTRLVHVR